jgi:hypothetical protein
LFMKGDLTWRGRPKMLAPEALCRLVVLSDEARKLVHAAVFRTPIQRGVIDIRLACIVVSHGPKINAPPGSITRVGTPFTVSGNLF